MQPAVRLLVIGTLTVAGVPSLAGGDITITWDCETPVFLLPEGPMGGTLGHLSGTVELGDGEAVTHYTFYNAFSEGGECLDASFTPEFSDFLASGAGGSFSGPVIEFTLTPDSSAGVYDLNPFDQQLPFPYLQLLDANASVTSNSAGYELIVVDQFPPLVDLDGNGVVDGADLGMLLGEWGCMGAGCKGDLNKDGVVDGADLGILLGDWTP